MVNYYKILALNSGKKDWMIDEIRQGRLRFGWSKKGNDLRVLANKKEKTDEEKIAWRKAKFILEKLKKDDVLIVQLERPLRKFMVVKVVEVNGSIYDFDGEQDDFNHIIYCKPITNNEVNIDSNYNSKIFKHDMTKRGSHYEIYNEDTIEEINYFIVHKIWEEPDFNVKSILQIELEKTHEKLVSDVVKLLANDWKSKDFDILVSKVFSAIDGADVIIRELKDDWDILLEIKNPILNSKPIEIPVICKNYSGEINVEDTIRDLERCLREYSSNSVYLVMLGTLTEELVEAVEKSKENMIKELGKHIDYEIIDEREFANLYLSVVEKL
ncbi:hypothetical protein [Paraclostridium tenue]|uniref:Restriction endonuclease type IV Mrr domain-containing protein n=1 Tax=Paraclostridium tenue TaxID=1737 RepID=A0ABN1M9Q1_9FIRM